MPPGVTFIYKGRKELSKQRDEFAVTDRTIVIDGVTCRVVHDKVFVHGVLQENTFDYFAQDRDGNVWYFGEDTEELDKNGKVVSTAGTWRAGVDGAQPGVIMEAHPKLNDHYFQEVAAPLAQDEAIVVNLHETVTVPLGKFKNCLVTKEFTQLEPGNIEHEFYARGVGFILGVVVNRAGNRFDDRRPADDAARQLVAVARQLPFNVSTSRASKSCCIATGQRERSCVSVA